MEVEMGEGGKAARRIELMGSELVLEVQLVRTINYIEVLETYLASLAVDQSRIH